MLEDIEILKADEILCDNENAWWSNILTFDIENGGLIHSEFKFNFEKHFLN